MPKISVIVPVYNVEKYLLECVDSILAQTFTDFELILINDGSQDNSGAICDEYADKDSRIAVIHQENQGQAAANQHRITDEHDNVALIHNTIKGGSTCEHKADFTQLRRLKGHAADL